MIKLLLILVFILTAIFFGYKLSEIEGRIIIDLAGTIIQTSLLGSAIIIIFSVVFIWLFVWLLTKMLRAASGSRNWFGSLSKRQQTRNFYQSINAMLMNNQPLALKHIRKSTKDEFNGTNYLIAAELERQAGNLQQAQAYLIQAMDNPEVAPLALMKQAELCLQHDQAAEAMTILASVEGDIRKTKGFITLKLHVLEGLNDWDQIETVATENKRILGDDYVVWASQWTQGEFAAIASKQGTNALKSHWQQLSRSQRKDQANQITYIQLLIDQGQSAEAEHELVEIAAKQSHPEYWKLFKQLSHPNPAKAMKFIEHEIKKSPNNAQLYSVLANLAYNIKDYELAGKALHKALELDDNRADKALLASVLEKNNQYEQANTLYKGLLQ